MSLKPYKAITSWAEEDRPREKLLLKGKSSLSNAELLAILIGSGSSKESAVDLSKRILASTNNNLQELSKNEIDDLIKFKGIGEAKAISIIAAMELGRRYRSSEAIKRKKVQSSKDAYEAIYSYLSDIKYEEFYIVLLNRANEILSIDRISEGGVSGTVVDPKRVFKIALQKNASGIILCHNHPSGQLLPSPEDKRITDKIKDAAKFMDISLFDHLIVGNNKYYSFADEGIL
jgi:DNA repair protein RadC